MTPPNPSQRIAKTIAQAGLCSRRDAEVWILEGRVQVNGTVIDSPALNVTDEDEVMVDGAPLPKADRVRLWLYHKPRGLITTAKDPQKRPTVFDNLPKHLPRVISVGRLDLNSEGLLLLTNNGALSKFLTDPSTGLKRLYRVRVHGHPNPKTLKTLSQGITIDDFTYAPCTAQLEKQQGDNAWVTMTLTEGKNREVRKIMAHLGHPVSRLIRTAYGPFKLKDLKPWAVEEVTEKDLTPLLTRMTSAQGDQK